MQQKDNIRRFSMFSQFGGLTHAMSTRAWGDMRGRAAQTAFFNHQQINSARVVMPKQVHAADIGVVGSVETSAAEPLQADGLVTRERDVFLAVLTADCAPVLFYERVAGICGIAHAGWRGTLADISAKMVGTIRSLGGNTAHLFVVIAPRIGACCYTVPVDRVAQFAPRFGKDARITFGQGEKYHLDLAYSNYQQLLSSGVIPDHLAAPLACTACQSDEYFSYRADTTDTFGEMISIIGMKE